MAQVALSLVLLVGAGLFLGTLGNFRAMNAGFERGGILLATFESGSAGLREAQLAGFYQAPLQRVHHLPGVRGSSLSMMTPVAGGGVDLRRPWHALIGWPGFDWHDGRQSPPVAIINQTMASYYFHKASPLGRWVALGDRPPAQIVGMVADAKYISLREPAQRTVYANVFQRLPAVFGSLRLEVRTDSDPLQVLRPIRSIVREIGGDVPVNGETTFDRQIDESLLQERLMATLSGFFGGLALLLAAIGLYGVLADAVGRRTSEIGIHMAMGAGRKTVLWMVLRETVGLVAIGIAIGLPLTLAVTRPIGKMFFGLTPADPLTIALAVLVMLVAAAVAGYVPARRASSIDPLVALRHE